jgi:hypothetical protein
MQSGHRRTLSTPFDNLHENRNTTTSFAVGDENDEETAVLADLVTERVSSIHRRPYLAGSVGRHVVNGGVIGTPESDNPPPLYGE